METMVTLTYNSWLKINKDSTGDMFPCTSFTEKCIEGVISSTNGLVRWHLSIRLDTMLQTVQLPASIANLHSSLTNMNRDTLTLQVNNSMCSEIITALPFWYVFRDSSGKKRGAKQQVSFLQRIPCNEGRVCKSDCAPKIPGVYMLDVTMATDN